MSEIVGALVLAAAVAAGVIYPAGRLLWRLHRRQRSRRGIAALLATRSRGYVDPAVPLRPAGTHRSADVRGPARLSVVHPLPPRDPGLEYGSERARAFRERLARNGYAIDELQIERLN